MEKDDSSTLSRKIDRDLPPSGVVEVNKDLCIGCRTCEMLCSMSHEGASSHVLARIRVFKDPFNAAYVPKVCKQCPSPNCLLVCPVEGAFTVDNETGARIILHDLCNRCGMCAEACPWGLIWYDQQKDVYLKCDLCGGDPRCVDFCPTGSLLYIQRGIE